METRFVHGDGSNFQRSVQEVRRNLNPPIKKTGPSSVSLGIDEKSFAKGHKYSRVASDLMGGRVVEVYHDVTRQASGRDAMSGRRALEAEHYLRGTQRRQLHNETESLDLPLII